MITFQQPRFLFFLLIIPIIILLHFIAVFHFKKKSFKFANFETIARISKDKQIFSKKISHLLLRIAFVTTLVLAMAGTGIQVNRPGIKNEIVFAVDTSGSMLATDLVPDRLEATKAALSNFIGNLSFGTKIGLISFTYNGYIEHDVTSEKIDLLTSLKDINIKRGGGTSIGSAISVATALFDTKADRSIVIFSDGQENFLSIDELDNIIDYATSKGISIYFVGVGSLEGAPMGNGSIGTLELNEDLIKKVTERGNGQYKIAGSQEEIEQALNGFFDIIDVKANIDLTMWLFMISYILLVIEWFFANYIARSFP